MPSNVGSSSQLVLRAREAAMRATAAQTLGVARSAPLILGTPDQAVGLTNPTPGPIRPAQPPTSGAPVRPTRETMFAETESFLKGIDPFSGRSRQGV